MYHCRWLNRYGAAALGLLFLGNPAWSAENELKNGSFENHGKLKHGNWGIFKKIPHWNATKGKLEIQKGKTSGVRAVDGRAKVELDSHKNSSIVQRLNHLQAGEEYRLTVHYFPRVKNHPNTNKIKISWNNKKIAILNGKKRAWKAYSFTVVAKEKNKLQLKAMGKSDSYGGLIDDLKLVCISCDNGTPDTIPPTITLNGENPLTVTQGEAFTDPGAMASDDRDGAVDVGVSGNVDTATVGTYTLIYTATDAAGNVSTVERTVNVIEAPDTVAPVITLTGDSPLEIVQGESFTDPGAIATDDRDGGVDVSVTGTVDTAIVGIYTLIYTATDAAGNVSTVERTVNVIEVPDTVAPVITLTGENPLEIVQGESFTDPGANATDDRDGAVDVSVSGNVDIAIVGTYTLTYTATDAAENTATVERTVNVIEAPDTVAPVITLTGENPLEIVQGENFTDPGAMATDDRDGAVDVIVSGNVETTTVGDYTLTYSATDNAGNTSTVTRTVNVITSPQTEYGIEVSGVSGHTAFYNAVAEFYVSLESQPSADVVIPISSSNPQEGIPDVESLTFSPDNWRLRQQVIVKGRNPDVENGEQDYHIILGAADSVDQNYHGIDPEDVPMRGIRLSIEPLPADYRKVIAGKPADIRLFSLYSGNINTDLNWSLTQAPAGMSMDGNSLVWTAPLSEQGKSIPVTVSVTDGKRSADMSFELTVSKGVLLETSVEGKTITITDESSSLKGLQIELLSDNFSPDGFKFYKMDPATVPAPHEDYPPSTDTFYVESNYEEAGELVVKLPMGKKFPGTDWTTHDMILWGWLEDGEATDVDGGFWSDTGVGDYEVGADGKAIFTYKLYGMSGLFYIHVFERGAPLVQTSKTEFFNIATIGVSGAYGAQGPVGANEIACDPKRETTKDGKEVLDYNKEQDCYKKTDINKTKVFKVKGFGTTANATQWGGVTIQQMVAWLFEAQESFDNQLTLSYDDKLVVKMTPKLRSNGKVVLGYVTTRNKEDRKILHLTTTPEESFKNNPGKETLGKIMKGTVVHEYFHHAQARSKLTGQTPLIGLHATSWFTEGTARWFEDYLYDDDNSYVDLEGGVGRRIMEVGLNKTTKKDINKTVSKEELRKTRSYQRFTFFKLLRSKCSAFDMSFIEFLNNIDSSEPSGINNLLVDLPDADCNFGSHLGDDKKDTMEAALLYYQYATIQKNRISLLDKEGVEADAINGTGFSFDDSPYAFVKADAANSKVSTIKEIKIDQITQLPPYSSYSIRIKSALVNEFEEGKEAVLKVAASVPLTVSLLDLSDPASDLESSNHSWFTTDKKIQHTFESDKLKPYFITLVNPSAVKADIRELSMEVRDIPPVKKTGVKTTAVSGDDGSLQQGIVDNYIRDDANNTVSDQVTELMWQDTEEVATVTKPYITEANFAAKNYADTSGDTIATYCQSLELGGFDDWKVPTLDQYLSIANFTNLFKTVDSSVFKHIASSAGTDYYWSATDGGSRSYIFRFFGGISGPLPKNTSAHVRCVRRFQ